MRKIHAIFLVLFCVVFSVKVSAEVKEFTLSTGITYLEQGTYLMKSNQQCDMNVYNKTSFYGPAVKVKENCTVVLNMNGYTLTLTGQNASEGYVATPAIEIPESSKLIITGWGGTLELRGGNGLQAQDGGAGGDGSYECHNSVTEGWGAAGGRGGYGSAPAIGTWGGKGGSGASRPDQPKSKGTSAFHYNNATAPAGDNGESTLDMGTLIVLGTIRLIVDRGDVDSPFSYCSAPSGNNAADAHSNPFINCFNCGAGGGGGQGGAAMLASYCIGAGAPGGGGGGAGGNGGIAENYKQSDMQNYPGTGGKGGSSSSANGANGSNADGETRWWMMFGGNGGESGSTGSHGAVYYTTMSDISSPTSGVDAYCPATSRCLNEESDPFQYLPTVAVGKLSGATFTNGDTVLRYYNGMNIPSSLTVQIPTPPTPNAVFKGYWNAYGDRFFDENGHLAMAASASHSKVIKGEYEWYFATAITDMKLVAHWSDRITVVENHIVEDAEKTGDDRFNCDPFYSETWTVILNEGQDTTITSVKFSDHLGQRLDTLLTADEVAAPVANRRFRIAEGEPDSITVTLSTDSLVVITHRYERNEFDYALDYSAALTDDEFNALLQNADQYTQPGSQKYGRTIVRPVLNSLRGKYISDWTPSDAYAIPVGGITLTAVEVDTTYYISTDIKQGETDCSVEISKTNGVAYQEQVTVNIHIVGQTCLSDYLFTTIHKQDTLLPTRVNDSTFTFPMPDDDVAISMTFAKAHYGMMTSLSNDSTTKIAVLSYYNHLIYTDHNDYFRFPDSLLGGEMKDMMVYHGLNFDLIAELDKRVVSDSIVRSYRPTIVLRSEGHDTGLEGHTKSGYFGGRIHRYYSYYVSEATNNEIQVMWAPRIAKQINFNTTLEAGIDKIFTDFVDNAYNPKHNGGTAYHDDVVYFTVSTSSTDFGLENIEVYYLDADGKRQTEFVGTICGMETDSLYYYFPMPGRDVTIVLRVNNKVNVTNGLPMFDVQAEDGLMTQEYDLIVPQQAVVGTNVSFAILSHHSLAPIKHAIALCNDNRDAAADISYGISHRVYFGEPMDVAIGTFVAPQTDVTICNGFMLKPDMKGAWFGLYADEDIMLPEHVVAYDVLLTLGDSIRLQQIESGIVPANHPVVCTMDYEMYGVPSDSEDFHFFLHSDPNSHMSSDVIPYISGNLEETTVKALRQKHGEDNFIYVLDFDSTRNMVFFRLGNDDEVLLDNSIYLIRDAASGPIYPMGVQAVSIDASDSFKYNIMGQRVNDSYRGIVIQNGKKYLK